MKGAKPYILSIPFTNSDNNSIAGIIFVYSNQHVFSYAVEVSEIQDPKLSTASIYIEGSKGEILPASNVVTSGIYIDWNCVWSCIPGALSDCSWLLLFFPPAYPVCVAAAWAFCYDWCTLFP